MSKTEVFKPDEKIPTNRRTVAVVFASYRQPVYDPITGALARDDHGTPALVQASGERGDEIDLIASEEERLDRLGGLVPKEGASEDLQALHDEYRAQRGDVEALERHVTRAAGADPVGGIEDVTIPEPDEVDEPVERERIG